MREYSLIPDSGGGGAFRGGLGIRRRYEILADKVQYAQYGDRFRFQPDGLFGGEPGAPASCNIEREGETTELPCKENMFHTQRCASSSTTTSRSPSTSRTWAGTSDRDGQRRIEAPRRVPMTMGTGCGQRNLRIRVDGGGRARAGVRSPELSAPLRADAHRREVTGNDRVIGRSAGKLRINLKNLWERMRRFEIGPPSTGLVSPVTVHVDTVTVNPYIAG